MLDLHREKNPLVTQEQSRSHALQAGAHLP